MIHFSIPFLVLSCSLLLATETPVDGKKDTPSFQMAECSPEFCCLSSRPIRVSMRHLDGDGIGYNQGYTSLTGFFPYIASACTHWITFLDLRGHIFNNGKPAANAGLGLRYVGSRIWGVNGYYDYRKTNKLHYNQVSAGVESLGRVWDFRANGYLPIGKKVSHTYDASFDSFKGHYIILSEKYEFAMKGFNAEAGVHVDSLKHIPFYFAGGPYYLTGRGATAWGGQLRARVDLFDYLRLEGATSYDHTFRWTGQGQISLNIPLGSKQNLSYKNCCESAQLIRTRALQDVDRFEIIPVDHKKQTRNAINPLTNDPYYVVFVDNTSHSNGTYESPYSTLADAQANSSAYDIIYLFPGDGTSTGLDTGFVMQDYQKLWGAGFDQLLNTELGLITVPAQAIGYPYLSYTAASGQAAVLLGNFCEVSGLEIVANESMAGGTPPYAILGDSLLIAQNNPSMANITVKNNLINGSIELTNCFGLIDIENNSISNITHLDGLQWITRVDGDWAEINILNNTVSNAYYAGLFVANAGALNTFEATISGNTISNTGWDAIRVSEYGTVAQSQRTITNNILTNTNTLQAAETGAITAGFVHPVGSVYDTLIIAGNTISTSQEDGINIYLSSDTSTATHLFDLTQTLSITNNTITNAGYSAIHIFDGGYVNFVEENATIANNTISGYGFNAASPIAKQAGGIVFVNYTAPPNHATALQSLNFQINGNVITSSQDTIGGIYIVPDVPIRLELSNNSISVSQEAITVDTTVN